jgi:hypothetical protein
MFINLTGTQSLGSSRAFAINAQSRLKNCSQGSNIIHSLYFRKTETIVFGKGQKFHDLDKELISLVERYSKHLPKDKTETVRSLIDEYKDLFVTSDQDLGRTSIVRHNIEMGLPKDYPCQVWINLVQRFQRRRFKCDLLSEYA